MQEQWHITIDTKEAAAFAALGATIKIVSSLHQRTAQRDVRLFISPDTTPPGWKVGPIRHAMKQGALARATPEHPYLTARRALENREAILDIQKRGSRFRLVAIPGAPGVWQYIPGDEGLPGAAAGAAVVRTQDLKMSAALATAGFPLLAIDGNHPSHSYTHAAYQIPAAPIDAARLITDWRADAAAMPFALPFVQAATALLFREQIRRHIAESIDTVLISKPGTSSHAAVRADATAAAWDKAARFFNGCR